MYSFIELTSDDDKPISINIETIEAFQSFGWIRNNANCFGTKIFVSGNRDSIYVVKEKYEEVKNKITPKPNFK